MKVSRRFRGVVAGVALAVTAAGGAAACTAAPSPSAHTSEMWTMSPGAGCSWQVEHTYDRVAGHMTFITPGRTNSSHCGYAKSSSSYRYEDNEFRYWAGTYLRVAAGTYDRYGNVVKATKCVKPVRSSTGKMTGVWTTDCGNLTR